MKRKCNVFLWRQRWVYSIITPVFSVTWSFRNHYWFGAQVTFLCCCCAVSNSDQNLLKGRSWKERCVHQTNTSVSRKYTVTIHLWPCVFLTCWKEQGDRFMNSYSDRWLTSPHTTHRDPSITIPHCFILQYQELNYSFSFSLSNLN